MKVVPLNVTVKELSAVMFRAACEAAGCTEDEGYRLSGAGPEQYDEPAGPIVEWINECPEIVLAVAKFLLNRHKTSSLFS